MKSLNHIITLSKVQKQFEIDILLAINYLKVQTMDIFHKIVEDKASSTEIDEKKLSKYLNKVSFWNYAGIFRKTFQQLSKDEKRDLLIGYYNAMVARFDGKFVLFLFLIYDLEIMYYNAMAASFDCKFVFFSDFFYCQNPILKGILYKFITETTVSDSTLSVRENFNLLLFTRHATEGLKFENIVACV